MKIKLNLSSLAVASVLAVALLAAPEAQAQSSDKKVSLYAGYAFFKTDDVKLHGGRLSPEYHLNNFASIVGDFSYERGSVNSGTSSLTTYLGGVRLKRGLGGISLYVHALAGGAKTTASIKPFGGVNISVSDTGLGLDGGGGLEFKAMTNLKVRLGADYFRRKLDVGGTKVNENDIRATVGVVF